MAEEDHDMTSHGPPPLHRIKSWLFQPSGSKQGYHKANTISSRRTVYYITARMSENKGASHSANSALASTVLLFWDVVTANAEGRWV